MTAVSFVLVAWIIGYDPIRCDPVGTCALGTRALVQYARMFLGNSEQFQRVAMCQV